MKWVTPEGSGRIAQSVNKPDVGSIKESSDKADDASLRALDALDIPLKAAKQAVSGDEAEWFSPEGLPVWAYAAGNTALDIVGDPLNLVGAGLAKGGVKATKNALKGSIATLDNYIPGHYGPRTPQPDTSKLSPAMYAAKDKIEGGVQWMGEQIKDTTAHFLSPKSRALYNEEKITTPVQKRIANRSPSDTRGTEKNVSQIQYTSGHIPTQTREAASTNPAAQGILNRSFIEGYQPFEPAALAEALQRNPVRVYTGSKTKPTAKDFREAPELASSADEAAIVVENFQANFPNAKQFVIKSPVAKETGGHFNDVVYKNPAKKALREGFTKLIDESGSVDIVDLKKYLDDNQSKYLAELKKAGRKHDRWATGRIDDNGSLWMRGSKVGSAITEGGVGWVGKIDPDGTMKVWMMDQHDFKEKVAGVNKLVPDDLVAITPAMVTNIKNLAGSKSLTAPLRRNGKVVKEGRKQVKKEYTAPKYLQAPPNPDRPYKELFSEYTQATPSSRGMFDEARIMAGQGMLAERANSLGDDQ